MVWRLFKDQLDKRWMLWTLLVINLTGTVYGFYWYKNQLIHVGSWLNIFVPDSPTASAAFTVVLALLLLKRHAPLIEAFAAVTLFKYGVWAVVMILAGAVQTAALHGGSVISQLVWTDWMLMLSHGGMAFQALLYGSFYTYRMRHLIIVAGWTLINDTVDYILGLHPWLPSSITSYVPVIGWFTVSLSFLSLTVAAWLAYRPGFKHKTV